MCRHSVLSLVGPASGTCDPGCSATLNWLFNPLAAVVHSVQIPVHIGSEAADEAVHMLTVSGRGYQPGVASTVLPLPGEATADERTLAGWCRAPAIPRSALLSVSSTSVQFGATELRGVVRRLLVLQPAGGAAVGFEWDMGEFAGNGASNGTISVEPACGEVLPGEVATCQLTFSAGSEAQHMSGEVAVMARALTAEEAAALDGEDGAPLLLPCTLLVHNLLLHHAAFSCMALSCVDVSLPTWSLPEAMLCCRE
jgi:hypothetical protein